MITEHGVENIKKNIKQAMEWNKETNHCNLDLEFVLNLIGIWEVK